MTQRKYEKYCCKCPELWKGEEFKLNLEYQVEQRKIVAVQGLYCGFMHMANIEKDSKDAIKFKPTYSFVMPPGCPYKLEMLLENQ